MQSFPEEDDLTPQEANAIGLEFTAREFPDFEVVVATHLDTGHLHNHLVVNSVNCADGKKLHQNDADLQAHRNVNDEICLKHGLSVLEKADRHSKKKRMKPGEYQASLRGESWKLDLIHVINEALDYADDRESFIYNVEQEGYQVVWSDTRKHITFITPEGWRCRDSSLHDETFLKENLEMLFRFRQIFGFTREPRSRRKAGWAKLRIMPWSLGGTWSRHWTHRSCRSSRPGRKANSEVGRHCRSWPMGSVSVARIMITVCKCNSSM